MTTTLAAELRSVTKRYGAFVANDKVDLQVREGTIHGLIGENGAGKSTTLKILYGAVSHDDGQLFIGGVERSSWNPRLAFEAGVGMVHQHFMLAHTETVLDNIVLGVEKKGFLGFRRRDAERAELTALMERTGLKVDLGRRAGDLTVGEQSRCEILKVLYRDAKLLILDEPTAVLTPQEVEWLLATLRKLRDQGRTILMVTHKLKEVLAVADDITVMRAGRTVGRVSGRDATEAQLTELMIGRPLQLPRRAGAAAKAADPQVRLSAPDFDVNVHGGEIVGIAGIEGNGQERIIEHLLREPRQLRRQPVAIIPPDRHKQAVVLGMTLDENLKLGREQAARKGWQILRESAAQKALGTFLQVHDVRCAHAGVTMGSLSGGNQQKLVVARELDFSEPRPEAIVVCHPTRGVDLGAIEHIHKKIVAAADEGAAVLLVSSELEELMNLSDRIGVVYLGRMVGWFKPPYDEKSLGRAMLTGEKGAAS